MRSKCMGFYYGNLNAWDLLWEVSVWDFTMASKCMGFTMGI